MLLIGLASLVVISNRAYAAFRAGLPDVHQLQGKVPIEDTLIYASDRKSVIADLHPPGLQHYTEPMSQMGKLLPAATVAVEDANFYQEHALDPPAIARAAWINYQNGRNVEGGSTITQQLVKMRLLGAAPNLDRKVREAALALEAERVYSKRQILEMYLNSVQYGNGAQGSRAAAEVYFHKATADLDLAQAAMLAGLPQNPTRNNPFQHWETAKARQRSVLDAMVRTRVVSADQADTAYAEDLRPPNHMFTPVAQIRAYPGFSAWVVDQLINQFGKERTLTGGLRVLTTVSPNLQDLAQRAIVDQVAEQRWRRVSQGALVSIDPHTGAVLAMVGAADEQADGGQYDMAVWPPRNPGSSFKIFTYAAAIESGKYTMVSPVTDSPVRIPLPPGSNPATYEPKNYDGRFHGTCQLQQCLGNSLNVPAVKVELGVGVPAVVQMARKLGAPPWQLHSDGKFSNDDPLNTYGYSLTLGGYGQTPLQMASAAAVLAGMGVQHPPYGIQEVRTRYGVRLFGAAPDGKQVLNPQVAFIAAQMLSEDENRAMIFGRGSALTLPGRRVAAKSGTTDGFTDAWTVGFTPDLATAVWMGNPDYSPMVQGSDGIYVAAPAWHRYMAAALDTLGSSGWLQEPPGLKRSLQQGRPIWFMPGTEASTVPTREPGGRPTPATQPPSERRPSPPPSSEDDGD
jgi:membrane peptidoglycan carboxypeptidase